MTPNGGQRDDTTVESTVNAERQPYRAPRLRRLGSVRELTLGASMGAFNEGLFQMKTMLGM